MSAEIDTASPREVLVPKRLIPPPGAVTTLSAELQAEKDFLIACQLKEKLDHEAKILSGIRKIKAKKPKFSGLGKGVPVPMVKGSNNSSGGPSGRGKGRIVRKVHNIDDEGEVERRRLQSEKDLLKVKTLSTPIIKPVKSWDDDDDSE